jgi:hypothetical protein
MSTRTVVCSIRSISFGLLLLLVLSQISSRAQDAQGLTSVGLHTKGLSDSTKRVVFDRQAFFGENVPVPSWENGYLVSHETETYNEGATNVRLFDSSGTKIREAAIWFPGSQRVLIYSAIPTPDGKMIASGVATQTDGNAGPFIVLIDGKTTQVIQTKDFAPRNICQAPDGTVWSFGGTGYDKKEPRVGDTLRHFDFNKGQIGSYIPRSTFARHPTPDGHAFIRCSAHGVSVYLTRAAEYIEMAYSGDKPHVYMAQSPTNFRLAGFAVTKDNQVYGHLYRPGKGGQGGVYHLSVNDTENTVSWVLVQGTFGPNTQPGVITALWGADGEQLLVSRAEDRAGQTALHWATVLE